MNFTNIRASHPTPVAPPPLPLPQILNGDQTEIYMTATQRTEEIPNLATKILQKQAVTAPTHKRNTNPGEMESISGKLSCKKVKPDCSIVNEKPQSQVHAAPFVPREGLHRKLELSPLTPDITTRFNGIKAKMNPQLDPNVNDPATHYSFDKERDRWPNILPSSWMIAKTHINGVERLLNANRLSYNWVTGSTLHTSLSRSQAPIGTRLNEFYHWIMDGMQEGKKSYIFNLLNFAEQTDKKKFTNYYSTEQDGVFIPKSNEQEDPSSPPQEQITVTTTSVVNDGLYRTYHLDLTMKRGNELVKQGKCDVINYRGLDDIKRIGFLPEFDAFVDKLITAENEVSNTVSNTVVVHCGAGRGRTGVAIAATLLKRSIVSKLNFLDISKSNIQPRVCNLIVDLRNFGGGHTFVQDEEGLSLLFDYASYLLENLDK